MELGKLGVLGLLDTLTSAETGQLAQKNVAMQALIPNSLI